MAFVHRLRWDTQLRYILRKKYWMHIEVREVEKPGRTAAKTLNADSLLSGGPNGPPHFQIWWAKWKSGGLWTQDHR